MDFGIRARQFMTMRISQTERLVTNGTDEYNQPIKSWSQIATDTPCSMWEDSGTTSVSDERVVPSYQLRAMVTKDSDFDEGDKIGDVTDRQNNTLFPGPMRVDAILHKRSHKIITLEHFDESG